MIYLMQKEAIPEMAKELKKNHQIFGPYVDSQTQQVFFGHLENLAQLDITAEIPALPPKDILFPQVDKILKYRYDSKKQEATISREYFEQPKVLFGIRPCDLAGVQCLDRFFLGQEYVDEVYQTHRKKCFIISVTCERPFSQCFCVCTHTGPAADEGFDLNLTITENGYLVETGSEKGEHFAKTMAAPLGLRPAQPNEVAQKNKVIENSIRLFPQLAKENKAWISRAMNRITTGFIKPEVWEYIGDQCFECGACSFVCPTCSCFNIEDQSQKCGDCNRLRSHDSCSFEGYTRMAGDHNPRKPVEDRRNKRFFCKLSYSQSKKYLRPGCVGCGRCTSVCPGDIGLPKVVEYIRHETIKANAAGDTD